MEAASPKAPESLVETGEAMPLPRSPSGSRSSIRAEARRRRVKANVVVVASSAAALAVVGICYALLAQ
jgi:F420-0:gamma-glutamyl ligase-like protein